MLGETPCIADMQHNCPMLREQCHERALIGCKMSKSEIKERLPKGNPVDNIVQGSKYCFVCGK